MLEQESEDGNDDSEGEQSGNEQLSSVNLENQAFLFEQSDGGLEAPVYVKSPYKTRSRNPKPAATSEQAPEPQSTSMKQITEPSDFDPESLRKGQVQIIDTAFADGKLIYKLKELDKISESIWIDAATFTQYNPAVLMDYFCKHF